jgi:CRP-like cAMP-binding protein
MAGLSEEELGALRRLAPMEGLPQAALASLIDVVERLTVPAGRVLFRRGERADALLFLLSGAVDLADAQYAVTPIVAGTPEAAYALDEASPHRVAAVATAPCVLAKISRDALDLALTWCQAGETVVSELSEAQEGAGDWMAGLLASPVFSMVAPAQLQALFAAFEAVSFRADEAVLREGEPGDFFYVVQQGACIVTRAGIAEALATFKPGDTFGEDALISGAARNATVTMVTDGILRPGQGGVSGLGRGTGPESGSGLGPRKLPVLRARGDHRRCAFGSRARSRSVSGQYQYSPAFPSGARGGAFSGRNRAHRL